jgi:hypothetical protein
MSFHRTLAALSPRQFPDCTSCLTARRLITVSFHYMFACRTFSRSYCRFRHTVSIASSYSFRQFPLASTARTSFMNHVVCRNARCPAVTLVCSHVSLAVSLARRIVSSPYARLVACLPCRHRSRMSRQSHVILVTSLSHTSVSGCMSGFGRTFAWPHRFAHTSPCRIVSS